MLQKQVFTVILDFHCILILLGGGPGRLLYTNAFSSLLADTQRFIARFTSLRSFLRVIQSMQVSWLLLAGVE
jgi:hypothetical protein